MNWRSEHIWVELLKGSRKRGNFFWACILFLGSLGFLSVGISSYLGKNIISILPRSYGYGKYRISDPSGKRRETDTQFKIWMLKWNLEHCQSFCCSVAPGFSLLLAELHRPHRVQLESLAKALPTPGSGSEVTKQR
uniref:Photosystem I assembly protein Ycf4 n=1 Tax=Aegilops tauschii subsp. strangulata TaxID=200361 RepID=A0A453FW30_AEGTS